MIDDTFKRKMKLADQLSGEMDDHEVGQLHQPMAVVEERQVMPVAEAKDEVMKKLEDKLGNPKFENKDIDRQLKESERLENPPPPKGEEKAPDLPKERAMIEGSPEEEAMESPREEAQEGDDGEEGEGDEEDYFPSAMSRMGRSKRA